VCVCVCVYVSITAAQAMGAVPKSSRPEMAKDLKDLTILSNRITKGVAQYHDAQVR